MPISSTRACEQEISFNSNTGYRMKILMISLNYAPEVSGIGKYSSELAEWFARKGHIVRVITASPYYPGWRVQEGYSARKFSTESINDVSVTRVPFWCPRRPNGVKRLIHLMSFSLAAALPAIARVRWRPDLVWVVEPPLFASPFALLTARLSGALCWLQIQDYEVDAAFKLGMLKGNAVKKLCLKFERSLLARMDGVSAPSAAMTQIAAAKGVPNEKLSLVPNWVDTGRIRPLGRASAFRARLGIGENVIVVLYSGNLGAKQGLELLPEAAHRLMHRRDIVFVICGNGPAKDYLSARAAELPNIKLIDMQPNKRFNELMGLADIHALPQRADAADIVMPSKLGGMLSSARPVIATAAEHTELWNIVRSVGVVTEPGNATALAEAIVHLANDPALRERLGSLGRSYATTHLSREKILAAFESRVVIELQKKRDVSDRVIT
jgi:colanic acid biosynthesis glycosyl transferase WcaI